MHWVRSGRRKVGWTAAVAVVIALVGHALLMAGGGHPAGAAHSLPASMVASPHGSMAHHAATAPDALPESHARPDAPLASHTMHGPMRSPAASTMDDETTVESLPIGGSPAGDPAAGCGGLLALAWLQPQPMPSSGSASVVLPAAFELVVLPVAENRVRSSRLDPTDPTGTRRALLQIYRL